LNFTLRRARETRLAKVTWCLAIVRAVVEALSANVITVSMLFSDGSIGVRGNASKTRSCTCVAACKLLAAFHRTLRLFDTVVESAGGFNAMLAGYKRVLDSLQASNQACILSLVAVDFVLSVAAREDGLRIGDSDHTARTRFFLETRGGIEVLACFLLTRNIDHTFDCIMQIVGMAFRRATVIAVYHQSVLCLHHCLNSRLTSKLFIACSAASPLRR